jgi:hypothetical protein
MGSAPDEELRLSLRGTISSSVGYKVRVESKTCIRYRDDQGRVDLDCEVQAGPDDVLVLFAQNWPEAWGSLRRVDLINRVTTALEYGGWEVLRSMP